MRKDPRADESIQPSRDEQSLGLMSPVERMSIKREELNYFHFQPHFRAARSFHSGCERKIQATLVINIWDKRCHDSCFLLSGIPFSRNCKHAWHTLSCHFPTEELQKARQHTAKWEGCFSNFPQSNYLSVSRAILNATSQKQITNLESRKTTRPK